jgi:hypothetical protein
MKPQNFMKSRRDTPFFANRSGSSMGLSIIYLLKWILETGFFIREISRPHQTDKQAVTHDHIIMERRPP